MDRSHNQIYSTSTWADTRMIATCWLTYAVGQSARTTAVRPTLLPVIVRRRSPGRTRVLLASAPAGAATRTVSSILRYSVLMFSDRMKCDPDDPTYFAQPREPLVMN